tara:strand:- start:55 stop:324 length:270 start_codon:yes stop_codon:yes gene_type:complete
MLLLLHHQSEQCGNASVSPACSTAAAFCMLVPSVNTAANRARGARDWQKALIVPKTQPERAQLQKTRTAGAKNLQEKVGQQSKACARHE